MKILSLINTHPELVELCQKMEKVHERHQQTMVFLKKQVETSADKCDKENSAHLEEVELFLRDLDLVPKDYDPKKHQIHVNHSQNAIIMVDRQQGKNFMEFMSGFFQ